MARGAILEVQARTLYPALFCRDAGNWTQSIRPPAVYSAVKPHPEKVAGPAAHSATKLYPENPFRILPQDLFFSLKSGIINAHEVFRRKKREDT